ncbi:MAG: ATPase, T2SS/T4P/T4SS family [Roseovarius sp.]|nr:ATPase, T2SS/T4P/T4SS family [Roseovarius sp.]
MLKSVPNQIAERVLEKLSRYYLSENMEEIAINRPGTVWIRKRRRDWKPAEAPELDYAYIHRLCRVLANINNARFSEDDLPIVSCELPGGGHRFQAIVGSNVRHDADDRKGVALAVRALSANTQIQLSSYGLTSGAKLQRGSKSIDGIELPVDHVEALKEVVRLRESIIISGATSTGKTTFANKIIELIDLDHRIITVEDAREITVAHQNRVHIVVPRNRSANSVGHPEIVDALVRLTPDWIVIGELSIANSQSIYTIMGKGHPVVATVHAGSPEEAISAFANNMAVARFEAPLSGKALHNSIRSQTGAIVQLDRMGGKRRVVDIIYPSRQNVNHVNYHD